MLAITFKKKWYFIFLIQYTVLVSELTTFWSSVVCLNHWTMTPRPICNCCLIFSDTNNSDRSIWPPQKSGAWQVGDYPNDIKFIKKYLPKIKTMFTMHKKFIQKAQERFETWFTRRVAEIDCSLFFHFVIYFQTWLELPFILYCIVSSTDISHVSSFWEICNIWHLILS